VALVQLVPALELAGKAVLLAILGGVAGALILLDR
jgi:hypothetical protein